MGRTMPEALLKSLDQTMHPQRTIRVKRFNRSGNPTGSEFQVNQSGGNLKVPDVAADANNKFHWLLASSN